MANSTDYDSGNAVLATYNYNNPIQNELEIDHHRQRKSHRCLKVASYNVRTLNDSGKQYQLAAGCKKYDIDIVVIQEHRQRFDEELKYTDLENGLLVQVSAIVNGIGASTGGIGMYFSPSTSQRLQSCEKVSDRIMVAHLEGNPMLTVIGAYAPTECDDHQAKEAFYDALEDTTRNIPAHNVLIVAADFNARLGQDSHEFNRTTIGPHIYHKKANENGKLLTGYCAMYKLCDAQSYFPHRKGRQWTWTHPTGSNAQIDHLLIRGKWLNSLKNCRAYHNPNVNSDHRMICANINVSLRASVKKQDRIVRYNWHKLLDQRIKLEFELKLSNRFGELKEELMKDNVQSGYDELLNALKETADNTLGTIEKSERKHWVSEATAERVNRCTG